MNTYYFNKYVKYKTRYLNFSNLHGGVNTMEENLILLK
jgi:hypothetical protein